MSLIAILGAVETGLLFGLVAIGVFLSFRILNFPDLTVDGSLPLGAAVAATLILADISPFIATVAAFFAGCLAGLVTAWLNVRLKILHLLASILVMISLHTVNLRVMGKPNTALLGESTVFTPFEGLGVPFYWINPTVLLVVLLAAVFLVNRFLGSEMGLGMRATGANPRMAAAQGIHTGRMTLLGIALSNGLVALAGALFAQIQGAADITMGIGTIVIGLAAVILGEALLPPKTVLRAIIGAVIGSIIYRFAVAFALNADFIGLQAQDLKLITAVLVVVAMTVPGLRTKRAMQRRARAAAANKGGDAAP
ncbi:ABC transporter permease [Arhodomonas sp. AD133]|uniref:ABC transporter permease n=1 Tax=Arhodomonas sp. AD133 TaxID=3415009 RepID=UPI003EBB1DAF